MRVFCIKCGGWAIDVTRKLGAPIRYTYTCRDCGCKFYTEEWERYQKSHRDNIKEKMAELEEMKKPGRFYKNSFG